MGIVAQGDWSRHWDIWWINDCRIEVDLLPMFMIVTLAGVFLRVALVSLVEVLLTSHTGRVLPGNNGVAVFKPARERHIE